MLSYPDRSVTTNLTGLFENTQNPQLSTCMSIGLTQSFDPSLYKEAFKPAAIGSLWQSVISAVLHASLMSLLYNPCPKYDLNPIDKEYISVFYMWIAVSDKKAL